MLVYRQAEGTKVKIVSGFFLFIQDKLLLEGARHGENYYFEIKQSAH